MRTARIIHRNCPGAKLQGLSLGGNDPEYFEACLQELAKENAVDLFDTYIYHGYELAPEMSYPKVEVKRAYYAVQNVAGLFDATTVPVYDSPCVLTERAALKLQPAK